MSGRRFMFRDGGDVHPHDEECDRIGECRPVVWFDPENRERVAALVTAFWDEWSGCAGGREVAMQAALRSLIAEPKPDEPLGLGAVVEDAEGDRWVRAARIAHGWHRPMNSWARYADITAVRVLSEGVTP